MVYFHLFSLSFWALICPSQLTVFFGCSQYSEFYFWSLFQCSREAANENQKSLLLRGNHVLGVMMEEKGAFKSLMWLSALTQHLHVWQRWLGRVNQLRCDISIVVCGYMIYFLQRRIH